MSDTTTGLKAGTVAGIVYGILSSIMVVVMYTFFKATIQAAMQNEINQLPSGIMHPTVQTLMTLFLVGGIGGAIIGGIIVGLILGAIFGYAYNRIPGSTSVVKGIFFGLIIWAILDVLLGLADIGTYGTTYYGTTVGSGFVISIIYGYLTGFLFGKWKETPRSESNSWTEQ